jgi:polar amino acid transport system substrate-binding protein
MRTIVSALLLVTLAARSADAATLAEIKARGWLAVSIAADAPPWAVQEGGTVVGFDRDLLDRFAATVPFEIRITPVPVGRVDRELREGRADLVAGGIEITVSRATFMRFGPPLAEITRYDVIRKGDRRIRSVADLGGLRFGTKSDSASFLALTELEHRIAKAGGRLGQPVEFATDAEAAAALGAGKIAYMVGDLVSLARIIAAEPGRFQLGQSVAHQAYAAWAVAPGDEDLAKLIDEFVADQRRSGALAALQQNRLGRSFPDLPATAEAADWWTERPDKPAVVPIPVPHVQD